MARRQPMTPELQHFLVSGCLYAGPRVDFDIYQLAGWVCRGRLDDLRALWTIHGPAVKEQDGHGVLYADTMLAGGPWRWPIEPWRCEEHPGSRTRFPVNRK
jgi:hypothetical protein